MGDRDDILRDLMAAGIYAGGDEAEWPDTADGSANSASYELADRALAALDAAGYRIEPKTRMAYLCSKCDTTFVDFYPSSRVGPHECPEDCMADQKGEE